MLRMESSKIIKRFKCGYNVHEEVWINDDNKSVILRAAYTPEGIYITNTKDANRICNILGVKPQKINKNYNSCNIGFSKKNKKWYCWSYRDIYEFGIGSKITKDSIGYRADTPHGLFDQYTKLNEEGQRKFDLEDVKITKNGIRTTTYATNSKPIYHYISCGRGEWEAKRLSDAKIMAIATAKCILTDIYKYA